MKSAHRLLFLAVLLLAACGELSSRAPTATVVVTPQSCRADVAPTATTAVTDLSGRLRQVVSPPLRGGNNEQVIQISSDGRWLAVGTMNAVLLFERTTLALRFRCLTGSPVYSLAFSPDGVYLTAGLTGDRLTANLKRNRLPLWRVADGELVRVVASPRDRELVAFSPDSTLQIAGYGIWVYAWRVVDGAQAHSFATRVGALYSMAVAASSNGTLVSVVVQPSGNATPDAQPLEVWTYRLTDGSLVAQFRLPLGGAAALTGAGPTLALVTRNGVGLWHLAAGNRQFTAEGTGGSLANRVSTLAFSTEGSLLVGGTASGQVLLWDAGEGTLLTSYQLGKAELISVASDPTNQFLAALDREGTLTVWPR